MGTEASVRMVGSRSRFGESLTCPARDFGKTEQNVAVDPQHLARFEGASARNLPVTASLGWRDGPCHFGVHDPSISAFPARRSR